MGQRARRHALPALLLCASVTSPCCFAGEDAPFYTSSQNPFVAIFGLPAAEGGALAPAGHWETRLVFDLANNFAAGQSGTESIRLDGESYRATVAVRRGFGKRFEVGIDVPYVHHAGGILEEPIDAWHDLLDLPDGGRDSRDNNLLEYRYSVDGEAGYDLRQPGGGVGDVRLAAAWRIGPQRRGNRAVALRAGLELPTGDSGALRGSGSTDVSLRLAISDRRELRGRDFSWHGSIGVLLPGDADVLDERQESVVAFGSVAAGWRFRPKLAIKVQLDAHTPVYDGSLEEVGATSFQFGFGGDWKVATDTLVQFAVVEDIAVDTAPDVVINATLRRQF